VPNAQVGWLDLLKSGKQSLSMKDPFTLNPRIGFKTDDGYELYLKRNCSISPTLLAVIFIFLGLISVVIGVGFYFMGATLILPFSLLEVFALVAAYFYNALHANDFERLRVDSKNVFFQSKFGLKYREENFIKSLARVLPSEHQNLINLSQGQKNIHFGKYIHSSVRALLELEVKQALKS
jgi:uncharacterized membrane protein